jgi:hypothetical protein
VGRREYYAAAAARPSTLYDTLNPRQTTREVADNVTAAGDTSRFL